MSIGIVTSGVHHVAFRSADLARSRRFYAETLGFPVVLEAPGIFLCVAGQTAIAVRGPDAQTPAGDVFSPFRVGLDHIALGCADQRELERVAAALGAAGVENTGVRLDPALQRNYIAFKDPDRIAWELYMAPNLAIQVVEAYLEGLRRRDLRDVPFAEDVSFESPLAARVTGIEAVTETLASILPAVEGVSQATHVAEGEYVASRFDLLTPFGAIPVLDRFRVVGGALSEIRPFYDPRPIVEGTAALAR